MKEEYIDEQWIGTEREEIIMISKKLEPVRELLNKGGPSDIDEWMCTMNKIISKIDDLESPTAKKYCDLVTMLIYPIHEDVIKFSTTPRNLTICAHNAMVFDRLGKFGLGDTNLHLKPEFIHSKMVINQAKKKYNSIEKVPLKEGELCNSQEKNV